MVAQHKQIGKYATVNGLKMYYEIHGSGRPLVLLHGGGVYHNIYVRSHTAETCKKPFGDSRGVAGPWAYSGYRPPLELRKREDGREGGLG
jgi:pimeloyl-ACP methyl ester carboxylesterase